MKPSLDYLHQYPVESVTESKDGQSYRINFEGGAYITVHGEDTPTGIEGNVLQTVVFTPEETVLHFGTKDDPSHLKVAVPPTSYSITDPRLPEAGEYFPQAQPEIDVEGAIKQSREDEEAWQAARTAERPSDEYLAQQSEESTQDVASPEKAAEKPAEHPRQNIPVKPRPRRLS